jgi:hypothetical protein
LQYPAVWCSSSSPESPDFKWNIKKFSAACFEQKKTLHGLFTACSRPPIFHGQKFFSTAGFELLGREHGHLATLLYSIQGPCFVDNESPA